MQLIKWINETYALGYVIITYIPYEFSTPQLFSDGGMCFPVHSIRMRNFPISRVDLG